MSPDLAEHVKLAERAICGACLTDPKGLHFAAADREGLRGADFAHPVHQATWEAIAALRAAGRPVDLITVTAALEPTGILAPREYGAAYLAALTLEAGPMPEGTAAHARMVVRAGIQRQRAVIVAELARRPPDADPGDLPEQLAELTRRERAIGQAPPRRFAPAADRVLILWSAPRPPSVPSCCLPTLDRALGGGFVRGRNSLLIGATGRGKTGLAIQMSLGMMAAGWPLFYVSTELPEDETFARFLGQVLRRPWREVWEWGPSVAADLRDRAAEHLSLLTLVEYSPAESMADLVRWYRAETGWVPIIVVDVVQDLATHAMRRGKGTDARAAIREVSAECKAIAKEHGTVCLLLSHTSRAVSRDREANRTKTASDFESAGRDSADLEQDAATVLYLDTDDCPPGGTADARLHIAKASGSGRGQTVGLRFHGAIGIFEEDAEVALAPELRECLDAIRGGASSMAKVREALGIKTDKAALLVGALEARRLIRRTWQGIRAVDAADEK